MSGFKIESRRNLKIDLENQKLIVPNLYYMFKEEDYHIAFRSNLAVSFIDAFYQQTMIDKDGFVTVGYLEVHEIANIAANNFIKTLLS